MDSNDHYTLVRAQFIDVSAQFFELMKERIVRADEWTFSLHSVDDAPTDLEPGTGIADKRGAVAFMLRRVQALRFLLSADEVVRPDLAQRHAADLTIDAQWASAYLNDASAEDLVSRFRTASKNVLAYMVLTYP